MYFNLIQTILYWAYIPVSMCTDWRLDYFCLWSEHTKSSIKCRRHIEIMFCSHSSIKTWVRLMDLVVQPSCQTARSMRSPPRLPSSWVSPKSVSKTPELSLLQTPQVVKVSEYLEFLLSSLALTAVYWSVCIFLVYF